MAKDVHEWFAGRTRDGKLLTLWYERDEAAYRAEVDDGVIPEGGAHSFPIYQALLDDEPIEVERAKNLSTKAGKAVAVKTREHGTFSAIRKDSDESLHDQVLDGFE